MGKLNPPFLIKVKKHFNKINAINGANRVFKLLGIPEK